jgi:hypothetical protein
MSFCMVGRVEPENPQALTDGAQATLGTSSVFISYSSRDVSVATAVVELLERNGVPCWIAPRDVRAGALYADAIVRAISGARALVPGGHLKIPRPWPGQNPPPGGGGTIDDYAV